MAVQSYVASEDKNQGHKRQRTYTTCSICQFNQDGEFSAFPFVLFEPGTLSPTQITQWHHHQPPRDQDRTALRRGPALTLLRSWGDPWETPQTPLVIWMQRPVWWRQWVKHPWGGEGAGIPKGAPWKQEHPGKSSKWGGNVREEEGGNMWADLNCPFLYLE